MMIASLDLLRSKILKETLSITALEHLFRSRSSRLLVLGSMALSFYFFVSAFFPLWVLFIGPILWGVPHIISSLRYNTLLGTSVPQGKKLFYFQSGIWLTVFLYRISIDIFHIELPLFDQAFLFEGISLIISFLAQVILLKKITLRSFLYFMIFALLLSVTYEHPVKVGLCLLIGHNYIPLITWFQSCQNKKDLKVFYSLSLAYIVLSILLYLGIQDNLYGVFHSILTPQETLPLINWDFMTIAEPFGAQPEETAFWFRMIVLYAFSQSIHYFLWLKAIPENHHQQEFPPSFRWSFQKLKTDFGGTSIMIVFILLTVGFGYWAFFEYQVARTIYFAVASYHGFMELSCLPFLKSNRSL